MKIKFVAMILCAVLVLTSCGSKLESGEIVSKNYSPAHTTVFVQTIPIFSGGRVISYSVIPQTVFHKDSWTITVQGEVDGKPKTDVYTVAKNVYEAYDVGDHVVIADLGLAD